MTSNTTGSPPSSEIDLGGGRTVDALVGLLKDHAGASQIADVVVRTWVDIEGALSPVLGKRGVAALYKRSLHMSGHAHDWLTDIRESPTSAIDFETLQAAFAVQRHSEAVLAAGAMLTSFCNLLESLVGESLTGRLLSSVLIHSDAVHPPKAL